MKKKTNNSISKTKKGIFSKLLTGKFVVVVEPQYFNAAKS